MNPRFDTIIQKLLPHEQYLIFIDQESCTKADRDYINDALMDKGFNAVVILVNSDNAPIIIAKENNDED